MQNYVNPREVRNRRHRQEEAKSEQPLKWFVGFVVFILTLAITFADVEGAILGF